MQWKVPLSDIDMGDEEIQAVLEVLNSKWLSMGEKTQEFERAVAAFLGVKHAYAVSNGTTALHLAYAALGLKPGDEVILPALTFVATANAAVYTGAVPVFADITSLDDLTINPQDVRRKITSRTKAIAVMHYGGYACPMQEILALAEEYHLAVVEDAAHAPGAMLNGKMLGTIGDVGCFSFFSNKNLVTGEGGMVVTNRDDLAERIRLMRSHGMTTLTWDRHKGHAYSYDVVSPGFNYRMDEMRAALGVVQLGKLKVHNLKRQQIVSDYLARLADNPGVTIPFVHHPGLSSYHLFPILVDSQETRMKTVASLKEQGIQTSMHYPPVHLFSHYRNTYGFEAGLLPLTEEVGNREITLPLYSGMSEEAVDLVVKALACLKF